MCDATKRSPATSVARLQSVVVPERARQALLEEARRHLGIPYLSGALVNPYAPTLPARIDCFGLVRRVRFRVFPELGGDDVLAPAFGALAARAWFEQMEPIWADPEPANLAFYTRPAA